MNESSHALELTVGVDRTAPTPMRRQLVHELRAAIVEGRLAPHTRLPSSRALAIDLGVSRGVVTDAYAQLAAEGYLHQRVGAVPRVRQLERAAPGELAPELPAARAPMYELVGTVPDLSLFPRRAWLAALRRSVLSMDDADLSYGDPRGSPVLRSALADYLGRVRGVSSSADRILITAGYTQGLSLVSRVLSRRGGRRVAVEDPGDDDQWDVIRRAGMEVVPCPVDHDGIRVDQLAATDVDAVVVGPAHQFPTGAVLAPDRRAALIEWVVRNDRLVIEDDYDSAYRYDRDPVGTVQGLAPSNVVQIGSVSKLLAPTLRLGWMVGPLWLVEEVARERWSTDAGHRAIDQHAFAAFIERGELDRHLRRTRQIYRRRRDALVAALTEQIPGSGVEGIAAGLHLVLRLPEGVSAELVQEHLADRRITLRTLDSYRLTPADPGPGLVIGYGSLAEPAIVPLVATLRSAITESRSGLNIGG